MYSNYVKYIGVLYATYYMRVLYICVGGMQTKYIYMKLNPRNRRLECGRGGRGEK